MATAIKGKRGPARKTDAELRASGSWLANSRSKKNPADRKPKAWNRELPGLDAILDPWDAITLIPSYDPYRNSERFEFDPGGARGRKVDTQQQDGEGVVESWSHAPPPPSAYRNIFFAANEKVTEHLQRHHDNDT